MPGRSPGAAGHCPNADEHILNKLRHGAHHCRVMSTKPCLIFSRNGNLSGICCYQRQIGKKHLPPAYQATALSDASGLRKRP